MPLKRYFVFISLLLFTQSLFAQQTNIVYLSGTDKDHTIPWDFFCTKGRKSGEWTKIQVPSNWELQGFGGYNYGHDKNKHDEQGIYKYSFTASKEWQHKKVLIVFEGVMTDAEVKVNGKEAGAIHQGGFYQFQYDITSLLQYDKPNELEVTVSKVSSNKSIERAERGGDFWVFGGIYRPVYLKIVPLTHIDRIAIDAKGNGDIGVQVFTNHTAKNQTIEAQVQELNGRPVGQPFRISASDSTYLKSHFANIRTWNPEQPNLYQLMVSIKDGAKVVHTIKQRFGFRTAELRPKDGFYVNGVKVLLKGVDRHSFWPESGRTLSGQVHLLDINLMKDMNMNAVRMSHYPPDIEFLDLCDSLGLLVIDELTGWQAAYDTLSGKRLVKELIVRDVNHPSVVMWSNGNEGGWNRALDSDYAQYDPQQRLVIHPWEKFNGTDTKHYPDYNYVINSSLYNTDVFFPTEFMHGLYDGGHGAGLDDFWNAIRQHPYGGGGFLWVLADEGIVRTDKDGMLDTDGNHGPDGIVGPHREKEGSYYTIKEIWSPVYIGAKTLPVIFNGKLQLENRYHFTNLSQCKFEWKLVNFPKANDNTTKSIILKSGKAIAPSIAPGTTGILDLGLPATITADALYLTATDPYGRELFTWSWPLHDAKEVAQKAVNISSTSAITVSEDEKVLSLNDNGITYYFDKATGYLQKVNGKKDISLSGGPALAGANPTLTAFKHYEQGTAHIIEASYKGDNNWLTIKWTFAPAQLPKLEYQYSVKGAVDYLGITFNYPEEKISGIKWLGRGPYRVWKNRLKGQQLGVWQKDYNNTITGESWNYPEFKGWHSQLYWVKLQTKESDFTVYTNNDNLFLQMLQPPKPAGASNNNTSPPFPQGNIGFMHAISAIGTKFQPAEVMGPQSQKNMQLNYAPLSGVLWFDFR